MLVIGMIWAVAVVWLLIELHNYKGLVKGLRSQVRSAEKDCSGCRVTLEEQITKLQKELAAEQVKVKLAEESVRKINNQNNELVETQNILLERIKRMYTSKPERYWVLKQDDKVNVYAHYGFDTALVKTFADDDPDYNLGLAEELKEKLEEKI
jgi:hypothetical protein